MDIESNSESKDSMDSVAQALMNIFSNDADATEDHSLSVHYRHYEDVPHQDLQK